MKTRDEIEVEEQKLLKWIETTDSEEMRRDFVQQHKVLKWVLE